MSNRDAAITLSNNLFFKGCFLLAGFFRGKHHFGIVALEKLLFAERTSEWTR